LVWSEDVARDFFPRSSWGTSLLSTKGTKSLSPWSWRWNVPPKRPLQELHDVVIIQKTVFLVILVLVPYSTRFWTFVWWLFFEK
jgi:hypothetical protein